MSKNHSSFAWRHFGGFEAENEQLLSAIGVNTLEELIQKTIPKGIQLDKRLDIGEALSEPEVIKELSEIANENIIARNFIGQGYYGTHTPTVILRNIFENPGWYTAYTPYQAEIAQGRLEMLINYQTLVCDLTAMEIANASLLDEGTAAAEAMSMLFHQKKTQSNRFFVSKHLHQQTIEVLTTRSEPLGIELVVADENEADFQNFFAAIFGYPNSLGEITDIETLISKCKQSSVPTIVVADLLSLCLVKPPGEMGADVVVGSAQRFGVPMGFGGPHAAFFATKNEYKRLLPGRIIGISLDSAGKKAFRMSLQTREQHIRREKATSNICTAQVLLSVMAAAYAVYHGPDGLKSIASEINNKTNELACRLQSLGYKLVNQSWFDTLTVQNPHGQNLLHQLDEKKVNLFQRGDGTLSLSVDETTTTEDIEVLLSVFSKFATQSLQSIEKQGIPERKRRTTPYLTHPTFNTYRTEHEMLRYLKRLENKDLSMVHSMISLGSCTMKLNATTEMIPVSFPGFSRLHPFAPQHQTKGYQKVFDYLEKTLAKITGFAGVSLQPNSGAQGEYAGLMVIRAYHKHNGHTHRNIALIPSSAHGTNPASAVMAGMKVVVVPCDASGNIDVEALRQAAETHQEHLACLMVTYPSTHGVFETRIKEICDIVHQKGGLVYMDGANMNAQVGLTSPAMIGADVCHLNLHKTFCIPHGGGGPGMGPICVAPHLVPFLPSHSLVKTGGENGITAVSSAPYGSASILLISYAYCRLMGGDGLAMATRQAILKANYIKSKLQQHYPILYLGENGMCAHELILDCRGFKLSAGVEVEDIAKRLMDYGFHAPTVSFPVAGTLMIEPTESESLSELDRFIDAMISIREEIQEIENGLADKQNNVLKNAPHTQEELCANDWTYPYTRQKAAFAKEWVKHNKFWPSVKRIDGAYGDRNLVCTCAPAEEYA